MNYPNGLKKQNDKKICYSNRGMALEMDLNESNNYYLINKIASIHKKPTPVTITKVDYPSRCEAVIKEGYFKTPSTTDYNGVYRGKYIDFEAKQTRHKNFFPLSNIHKHQLEHLRLIIAHGGIGFIIIRFNSLDKTYYLDGNDLIDFINVSQRKSIPISFFEEKGYIIKPKFNPRVDYLEIVNNIYFGGDRYEK
jgi:recombination protein U